GRPRISRVARVRHGRGRHPLDLPDGVRIAGELAQQLEIEVARRSLVLRMSRVPAFQRAAEERQAVTQPRPAARLLDEVVNRSVEAADLLRIALERLHEQGKRFLGPPGEVKASRSPSTVRYPEVIGPGDQQPVTRGARLLIAAALSAGAAGAGCKRCGPQ